MAGPVSGRRIKRRTVKTIISTFVALGVIIAGVVGTGYITKQAGQKRKQEEKTILDNVANDLAKNFSGSVQKLSEQLDKLIKEKNLAGLLAEASGDSFNIDTASLAAEIPHTLNFRIFLPGKYKEDRESSPPLGFASLALLGEAEKSGNPDVEIHAFNSSDAHLVMIRRIENPEGKLLGLVHLSLETGPFLENKNTAVLAGGYAELVQVTGQTPLVLLKFGNAKNKQGTPISTRVKGARWRIDYWPVSSSLDNLDSEGFVIPVQYIVLLILLAGLAGGFLFLKRGKSEPADDEIHEEAGSDVIYKGAVRAIMEGQHPGLEKLIPNLPGMGQKKTVKPVSRGMEGDDVTKIAKPDQKPPATTPVKKPATTVKPAMKTPAPVNRETTAVPVENKAPATESTEIPAVIFRAYDIRGIVNKTLTAHGVTEIGKAIGSEAKDKGLPGIVVGHDGRLSSPELSDALIKGLRSASMNVIDIGQVPTPVLYFATHHLKTGSGVMITGSHNAPEYNGLKIVLGDNTLSGDAIQSLHQRIENGSYTTGQGSLQTADVTADYIRRATEDIPVALGGAFKIVVDCGNGVAGGIAPQLYRALGHDVDELFCEIDGKFPNHQPDPSQPANMQALINKVKESGADIGFAFDGDGDRLGVVDSNGNILWPDRQMMLFARDVLSRNPGAQIIFDVKCSRHLKSVIESSGGKAVMWKTGHSLIKHKMKELNAPLAGEMSGHIFFKERWYGFDDAMYAGARMLEILSHSKTSPAELFASLPGDIATPELRIPLAEKYHAKFMQALLKKAAFDNAEITNIDGLRADFPEGWGLIRPSNTTPCLVARFEAENNESLKKIQDSFRELIRSITTDLKLPF